MLQRLPASVLNFLPLKSWSTHPSHPIDTIHHTYMDINPEQPGYIQQQSPQAITALDPFAEERLCKLLGLPPSNTTLDTITINESASTFSSAILEYAALLAHANDPGNSKLTISRALPSQDIIGDSLFPEFKHASTARRYASNRSIRFSGSGNGESLPAGVGVTRKNAESRRRKRQVLPSIAMGMGDYVITWPPPKSIRPAMMLTNSRYGAQKPTGQDLFPEMTDFLFGRSEKSEEEDDDDDDDEVKEEEMKGDGDKGQVKHEDKDSKEKNKEKENGETIGSNNNGGKRSRKEEKEWTKKQIREYWEKEIELEDKEYDSMKPMKIGLSVYSVGEPASDFCRTQLYKELIIGYQHGIKDLYCFVKGVERWRKQFMFNVDSSSFELYRYKLDKNRGEWISDGYHKSRDPSTVILSKGMLEKIFEDANDFYSRGTRDWYQKHGLPHRRSYLFHGPPGTGKTSTIRVLAGELKLTCCFLQFSGSEFNNQLLCDAFKQIRKNSLLVIEDVDSLFNNQRESNMQGQLTFSGLLNVLDGLMSAEGLMTILTTNHIKKLDNALIRAGRIDRAFLFDVPGKIEVKRYFCSFYPHCKPKDKLVKDFVEIVWARKETEKARNISTLQQLFIASRSMSAQECVNNADEFFDSYFAMNAGNEARLQYVI